MNRRGTGAIFCLIAALLFGTRYVSAALFATGVMSWDAELFRVMLSGIGSGLPIASVISLIIGISYLIWAEVTDYNPK